ncbi:MAG TPA: hypothetical protein VJ111_02080 [Chitinophagaceae bacterium]|nr:hypothetical protein [Chitinophagaceae bacterium]
MKKLFFRYTGFIPLIALFSGVYAQNSKFSTELNSPTSKEVAYNHTAKEGTAPAVPGISTKAVKNFTKTFKNAVNANWFVIKNGYLAKFNHNGITTKVFYDPKGRLVGNLRCYFEDKLPRDIRHLVKSHYYDSNIYYVQEVTVGNAIVYLVKIEDKISFKTIRVQDGEMTETEAFNKSKL